MCGFSSLLVAGLFCVIVKSCCLVLLFSFCWNLWISFGIIQLKFVESFLREKCKRVVLRELGFISVERLYNWESTVAFVL